MSCSINRSVDHYPTHHTLRLGDPEEFSHQVQSVVPGPPYQVFRSFAYSIFLLIIFCTFFRHLHPGPIWSTRKHLVFLEPLTRALDLLSLSFSMWISPLCAGTSCRGSLIIGILYGYEDGSFIFIHQTFHLSPIKHYGYRLYTITLIFL